MANEAKGRKHTVQSYDSRNDTYSVVTARNGNNNRVENIQYVNFQERTCTCRKWTELCFPCSHVFAACLRSNVHLTIHIHPVYSIAAYRNTYSGQFHPLQHPNYWDEVDFALDFAGQVWLKRGAKQKARI